MKTGASSPRNPVFLGRNVFLTFLCFLFAIFQSQAQAKIYGSGNFNLNDGPVFSVSGQYIGSADLYFSSGVIFSGGVTKYGSGTLSLSGWNTYSGVTTVTGVSLSISQPYSQYTLDISALNGSVTKSPDQPSYAYNTGVNLSATPDPGYIFQNWTLNGSVYSTAPQILIQLTSNLNFVANFVPVTRIIGLNGSLLDWDLQAVGSSSTGSFEIKNTGNSPLNITGIIYPAGFSGNWTGQIAPGSSQTVTVIFNPTAPGAYGGNIQVSSDATGGSNVSEVVARAKNTYHISASSKFGALRTSLKSRTYWSGSIVRLRAFPVAGYTFKNWTEHGRVVSTSRVFKINTYRAHNLRANYQPALFF